MIYEVGSTISSWKHHSEGCHFELSDSGASMIVFFNSPTSHEIEQFNSSSRFEIRFTVLQNVLMLLVKIGSLNWMDAPYSPNLCQDPPVLQTPDDNSGLALTLILVDAVSGEIKHMRLIGLSSKFTTQLFRAIENQLDESFNEVQYMQSLQAIYNKYPTTQLVKLSSSYFRKS